MRTSRRVLIALAALGVLTAMGLAAMPLLGIRTIRARPEHVAADANAALTSLQRVLDAAVRDDGVDYDAVLQHRAELAVFAEAVSRFDAVGHAGLNAEDRALAWQINAYNGLTLQGVVEHWPIASVHDVRGLIEPRPGFGFFWAQHFVIAGRRQNLYDFENRVIRAHGDARIHAAINCASASCPRLAPDVFRAETLDGQLDAAATLFASSAPHVMIDAQAHAIRLSEIFTWFAGDFEAHARHLGVGDSVLDWIAHYADSTTAAALSRAREQRWPVQYVPYDWSLNRAR